MGHKHQDCIDSSGLMLTSKFSFQYVVFIVVGTGLIFMVIFHVGLKEPPRSCTYALAKKGSKRSASNWINWFKEVQFYQVCIQMLTGFNLHVCHLVWIKFCVIKM